MPSLLGLTTVTSFGVTLLSGGLDSTTVTAYARQQVDHLTALTFHYGQTHSKETHCAAEVARLLNVKHVSVDISFFGKVAWYSALTNPEAFPIPKDRSPNEMGTSIPITYVPLRNTFFLAIAGAYLESEVLYALEVEGLDPQQVKAHIFMAPNAIDYSGYPDCRPEFYRQAQHTLMQGSKLWTEYGVAMQVETPIIHMSKKEIVKMGMELDAFLEHTWSCYDGGEFPCMHCDSCLLRARGFAEMGVKDPLLVRLGRA